jgi:hypothetical protein
MPRNSWNEEGELSLREQLIATLAFKLNANISLTDEESVAQQQQLRDEDVFAVIKMAAVFSYWQELARSSPNFSRLP